MTHSGDWPRLLRPHVIYRCRHKTSFRVHVSAWKLWTCPLSMERIWLLSLLLLVQLQVLSWRTGTSSAPKTWLALSSFWQRGPGLWPLQLFPSPSLCCPRFLLQPSSHSLFNPRPSVSPGLCLCACFTCVQVGRTLSRVQQAFSWSYGEEIKPFKPPLSDAEFHSYLNGQGQLTRPEELRLRIYPGGVEPSLRKV